MGVELLGNNTGILDLTGGSNEPAKEEPAEVLDLSQSPVEGDDAQVEPTAPEGQEATPSDGNSDAAPSDAEPVPTDEPDVEPEYYFGEQQVTVEVPAEIQTALDEAGVDSKALLKSLFAKDGNFELDADMRTKLEEKFGKLMVDGYLNMYKGMNEQTMSKIAADKEAADLSMKAQQDEYMTTVGGMEGLEKVESFIVKNFDDNQIAAYNAVMESDSHAAHLLIISQVKSQMELADKLANGDKRINLVGDNTAVGGEVGSPLDKGYLTYDEYQTLIAGDNDKYWTDSAYMTRVDQARMAGQRKGL